jgi:hypothetical protein
MSNVEYRCPICGARGFFPPNMNDVYKCHLHTDTGMIQHEEFYGPNFEFKEEGEINPRKTGVVTHGAVDEAGRITVTAVKDRPVQAITEEEELRQLRETYERITKESVDKRWGITRLKKEIEQQEWDFNHQLEVASMGEVADEDVPWEDSLDQVNESTPEDVPTPEDAHVPEIHLNTHPED